MVEVGEGPDVTGVHELNEETTLTVGPDDLVLFDARSFARFGTTHKATLAFTVDFADVDGSPEADDEVTAARFWTPSELGTIGDRFSRADQLRTKVWNSGSKTHKRY